MIPLEVVVAVDSAMGIGKDGAIPWRLPGDVRHFKDLTTHTGDPAKRNAVLMGRVTWESLPDKFQPLPGRVNVVLTRQGEYALPDDVYRASTFDEAVELLDRDPPASEVETAFVIGGAAIYRAALASSRCAAIHMTTIEGEFECDTFLDAPPAGFVEDSVTDPVTENGTTYRIRVLRRASAH